jgi:hypothetical protein
VASQKKAHGQARSKKDAEMSARMRREGVIRTTGRCANCYRLISVESAKSRYTHICRG